jgi:hypothetical protein
MNKIKQRYKELKDDLAQKLNKYGDVTFYHYYKKGEIFTDVKLDGNKYINNNGEAISVKREKLSQIIEMIERKTQEPSQAKLF